MRNQPVFRKWFYSYLLFVGITVFSTIGIYKLFEDRMEGEISKINHFYLSQIKEFFDGQIKGIEQTMNMIGLTPSVKKAMNSQKNMSTKERYNVIQAQKDMRLYASSNKDCKEAFLYIIEANLLITYESVYSDYMDLFTQDILQVSEKEFKKVMSQDYDRELLIYGNSLEADVDRRLFYIRSMPMHYKEKARGSLIFEIDQKKIEQVVGADSNLEGGLLFMMDNDNNIIYQKGDLERPKNITYNTYDNHDVLRIKIDNSGFVLSCIKSNAMDIKYIRITPENLFWKEARRLRDFTIIVTILLSCLCVLLAYALSKKYYSPLDKLIKEVSSKQEISGVVDEYAYIENAFRNQYKEQQHLKDKVSSQQLILKQSFLVRLLNGFITDEEEIQEKMEAYSFKIIQDQYQVLSFQVNQINVIEGIDVDEEVDFAQFIISNILEEVLSKSYDLTKLKMGQLFVYILNSKEQVKVGTDNLRASIEESYKMIHDKFHIQFAMILSDEHQGAAGLAQAYNEVLETLEYAQVYGEADVMSYNETLKTSRNYRYSIELEYKLINYINMGDTDSAKKVIDQVYKQHLEEEKVAIETLHCLMFNLLSSVIKTLRTKEEEALLNEIRPLKHMKNCTNIEEMKQVLSSTLERVCDNKKERIKVEKARGVSEDVDQYIKENLGNADLNVSMLGEQFNKTPAYLSKLYKQETGQLLLNSINHYRIEKGKELIRESNLTINQISEQVGFAYSNAFIRVFKKYEGVTPGQYKTTVKKEKSL